MICEQRRDFVRSAAADSLYDPSGDWIGRYAGGWDVPGVMHTGGRMLAMYLSGTYFMHPNLHGSTTIDTNASGGSIEDLLFYPWGDLWASTSLSEHHFSGFQYRDDAHGLDPTLFRMYKYGLGRWMTPDPLGGDVTDPQSLNRYAYVLNNPTTLTDPLGLNPADNCSYASYYYSHARCGGSPPDSGCEEWDNGSCTGDPTCDNSFGLNGPNNCGNSPADVLGFPIGGSGGYGGIGSGASAPGAPPAGQPPLRGGIFCGPVGCVSPPFQNLYQVGESIPVWLKLLQVAWGECQDDPVFCAKVLVPLIKAGVYVGHKVALGTKAAANSPAVRSIQCGYAPALCGDGGIQNGRPWWLPTGAGPAPIPPQPTPVPIPTQPTVVLSPTGPPNPGSVVPVH